MKVALAQLEIAPADVATNVDRAVAAIEAAATAGADLVCLPEVFTVGYFSFDAYDTAAEGLDGPTLTRLAEVTDRHDVAVLAGSIVEDLAESRAAGIRVPDGELANTAVLFDSAGRRVAVYRKHHLFGYGSVEADLLTPGEHLDTATITDLTVGVTTCYDLRFPGLYRALSDRGATLILVPSAWPYPRLEHWSLLPAARAVENLCFLATCNGVGTFPDDGETLCGRSTVHGPWGRTLASTHDEPAIVTTEIEAERVSMVREEFPAWRDRRREFIP